MNEQTYNQIVSFIWNIADDCLRDVYVRSKYRDIILPMTVIRRLDAVLENAENNLELENLPFSNTSDFLLKKLDLNLSPKKLKKHFSAYLSGYSLNVQDILKKFKFKEQINTLVEAGILNNVIRKFISEEINLGPNNILDDEGNIILPAIDNHTMGTIFEQLIRRFSEANNEEAGEHFTPRDVVKLMADLIISPIAQKLKDSTTYSCYDGACGTGGMLTEAANRLNSYAIDNYKKHIEVELFGQESQPETYAIAKADLLLKGDGDQAKNIKYGSTISNDGHKSKKFDFMISNPPYGKSWISDAEKITIRETPKSKGQIKDDRFLISSEDEEKFSTIPRTSDGQMLFLMNNVSKMNNSSELGSRIVEVHNGSSLFTGDAGQGESNVRRYLIENDYLEAIIALPENMFYNTSIATFIWIISNKKSENRKGKVQLIDATNLKSPLRKNLGDKNCEITDELREHITKLLIDFNENEYSKIFDNDDFGYWKITVNRPLRLRVDMDNENFEIFKKCVYAEKDIPAFNLINLIYKIVENKTFLDFNKFRKLLEETALERNMNLTAKRIKLIRDCFAKKDPTAEKVIKKIEKGIIEYEPDNALTDTEQIPFKYEGGISSFFENEVRPFILDAWIDESKTQIGYEISFVKYFYNPTTLRTLDEIVSDIKNLETEVEGLLDQIIGG